MDNKEMNKSRRVLINSTLGLGALGTIVPSHWAKPIVNAVMLPAHAQTSPMFSVEKTQTGGPNPAMVVGDVLEYTIVVTNTGGFPLTEVVATDTLPDGTVVVLSGPVESAAADGVLEVGETWTYETTYTVSLDDVVAAEDLTNAVSVEVAEIVGPMTDEVDTPVVPVVCPDIVIDNVLTSTMGSGAVVCSLNFSVLSSDATPLTVTSITNSALSTDATVTYEAFPVDVTDVAGTLVAWTGGFATPECAVGGGFASDVVFTVEATCEGAIDPITMDFNLTDIAAMA